MTLEKPRPLSPHLSIYKPQISSVLSILHRITGVVLFLGLILMLLWLTLFTYHPDIQDHWIWKLFSTYYGKALLILWSYSLFFHLSTAIRHLFWDYGLGFEVKVINCTGWIAVIASIAMAAISWGLAFYLRE